MNTDIRLSVGFWQHPKTKKTVRRLGLEGIRSLQVLWLWSTSTGLTAIFPAWIGRTLSLPQTGRVKNGSFSTPALACGLMKPRTATFCTIGRSITRGSQKRWHVPRRPKKLLRHAGEKQTISTSNAQRMLKHCPSMIRAMPLFLFLLQKKRRKKSVCLTRARALNVPSRKRPRPPNLGSRKPSLPVSLRWRLTSSSRRSTNSTGEAGQKQNANG